MPCVGSSKMSTSAPDSSHFASTTFCWLPPERYPIGLSSSGTLICEPLDQVRARRVAPGRGSAAAASRLSRNRRSVGRRDVLADRERVHGALVLPVLGQQHDSGPHRVARPADRHRPALDEDPAGGGAVGSEDQPHELGAPRADEPGDAEDVARRARRSSHPRRRRGGRAPRPAAAPRGRRRPPAGRQRSTRVAALCPVMCSISWLRSTFAVGDSKTILPSRMTATSSVTS